MSKRGAESEPRPQEGFRVKAEEASVIHEWLSIQNQIAILPLGGRDSDGHLKLGELRLNNSGLIEAGISGILYSTDNHSYQIKSLIVLKSDSFDPLRTLLGRALQGPFSLQEIQEALSGKLDSARYTISYNDQEEEINVFDSENPVVEPSGNDEGFIIHEDRNPIHPAICLHLNSSADDDLETFTQKYESHASLLKAVFESLYQLDGNSPPSDKAYILAPSKNTPNEIESIRTLVKAYRKSLADQGIVEDSSLIEEVLNSIRMERRPDTTFEDIAGLEIAKEELQTIEAALSDPESFKEEGVLPPRGVLLYGPPGTGKTLLVKALAHETDAVMFNVNVADIVHHLYGKTERLIQATFDAAREEDKPVILFFDEIDALAAHRDRSTEVTSRIVSVMLTNLDGMEERPTNMVVIGTTNRIDAIDSALLRPGRLNYLIATEYPNDEARTEVFRIHMRKSVELAGGKELFDPELDLAALVKRTKEGFSPDDIREILRRTLDKFRVQRKIRGEAPKLISTEHVLSVIDAYERVKKSKEESKGQYL